MRISILPFLLTLLACNNANKNSIKAKDSRLPILRNGVTIDYTDSKIGDTTLLFIHGWGINQTYWDNQVNFFSKKFRVVTLDLPGFGKSGKNRTSWTVEDYGNDISLVLEKLELKNVILIGHSMSGAIIVETAIKNPSKIIALVGVDNFNEFGLSITPEQENEVANYFNTARNNYTEIISKYVNDALFAPSTDSMIKLRVLNDVLHSDSVISINCLEQNFKYPIDKQLLKLKKPLFLINSDRTYTDTLSFQKSNIECSLLNVGTTGHYPMLENVDKFNMLLQQGIDRIKN